MNIIPLSYKIYMMLVILIGGGLIFSLHSSNQVTLTDLQYKTGMVLSAECVKSKSVHGIKVLINYSGAADQDFFNLPIGIKCQEVVSELIGNDLTISYFENAYFGITVKDMVIRDTEKTLSEFNDNESSIAFVCFIVLISIFALYFKGKHVTSKGSGR